MVARFNKILIRDKHSMLNLEIQIKVSTEHTSTQKHTRGKIKSHVS